MPENVHPDAEESIRRQFKRCDEGAIQAIVRFRAAGDPREIPAIVLGIISRYLSTVNREILGTVTPETLLSDLHIESLTMLEIILDIQDSLDIVVEDAEMRQFVTLGDIYQFLEAKVARAKPDGPGL